ncbi:MAG TPA: hypothetical protein VK762_18060 [Polyangiaceae bacterium]|jgi:hypothetical protein|nr:hypothetical protein [Polyangiaceae bacterium]
MIVQSLRHAAWPVLLACASAVACSKTPATPDAFVNASLGGTLCPVNDATVINTMGMTSATAPSTTPAGQDNLSITCSVAAGGNGYTIQLDAQLPGSTGGELIVSGTVDATNGGKVAAQWVSQMSGLSYESNDCTLSYTYIGQPIPENQRLSSGQIWAHVSCPDAMQPNGSIAGTQTTGPDGGVINSVCDGEADILFSNCSD